MDAGVIAEAFRLPAAARAVMAREASPLGGDALALPALVMGGVALLLLLMLVLHSCSDNECDPVRDAFGAESAEYAQCRANRTGAAAPPRTGGGGFGGSGSGGGHK
jgi:hypothetical protein